VRGLRAVAVALVCLASYAVAAPLRRDGAWLRDRRGRVVLLRGVSYSGLEFGNFVGQPNGPAEADFAQMAGWGMNVVRLPVAWNDLEPAPGVFDRGHLHAQIDAVVRFARRHGIAVVIDMHQYRWSPCFGGNGVPAWTCEDGGYPPDGYFQAEHDFWAGALAPDGRRQIDHLVDVWTRLARHFRSRSNVIGFDFLNEPLDVQNAAGFEHDALYPFYREVLAAVRAARAPQLAFLEPSLLRNVGLAAHPEPVGDAALVYAPHLYTTTYGLPDLQYTGDRAAITSDYAQAAAEATAQGAVLWVGEYGGNTTVAGGFLAATELFLRDSLAEQEARLVGSAFWAYFPSDNTFSLVDASGAEKGTLVDLLARPFPMATAGIPEALTWDPDTRELSYRFAEDPAGGVEDPTVLFVPAGRHYPAGFVVQTSAGDAWQFDATRSRLVIRRDPSRSEHTVQIRPAS
jgi:endoglycosylceramidase